MSTSKQMQLPPYRQPPWGRKRLVKTDFPPTQTQQGQAESTEINKIVARFKRDGYMPPSYGTPQYADVSELQGDLTDRINQSQATLESFQEFAKGWKPPEENPPQETPAALSPE